MVVGDKHVLRLISKTIYYAVALAIVAAFLRESLVGLPIFSEATEDFEVVDF